MKLRYKKELKIKIVEISKRLYYRGFVSGSGGNVSVRIFGSDKILVTPSGLSKGFLKISDIIEINLDGTIVEGVLKPTSETPMHTTIYKVREDVNAVIHAHPPISTGFACTRVPLNLPIFPDSIAKIGEIATIDYTTPTTTELAQKVGKSAINHDALLLRNHGTITLGTNLEQAYQRTEILEDLAKIVFVSKLLGGPDLLSESEVKKIRKLKTEK